MTLNGYPLCEVCKTWGVNSSHTHTEVDIRGILDREDLKNDAYSQYIENKDLEEGDIIYKYFDNRTTIDKIRISQNIGSRALCICEDCIVRSLGTKFLVHYGDGAYGTYHENLKDSNISDKIIETHGINVWIMKYRVRIRIKDGRFLKKIPYTAGVFKSIPSGKLKREEIVLANPNSIQILGFEEWNGTEWIDITFKKYEGD